MLEADGPARCAGTPDLAPLGFARSPVVRAAVPHSPSRETGRNDGMIEKNVFGGFFMLYVALLQKPFHVADVSFKKKFFFAAVADVTLI